MTAFRVFAAWNFQAGAPTRLVTSQPEDAPHGSVDGPRRLSVLVAGGLSGAALGVPSYQLGVARHLAVQFGRETGRGVDWESLGPKNLRLETLAAALREYPGLASFDLIVLSPGIADLLALSSIRAWRTEFDSLLRFLDEARSERAIVLVTEVPDITPYVQVGPLIAAMLIDDTREFVLAETQACALTPGVHLISLPTIEKSDFVEDAFSYATLYRRWGHFLGTAAAARIPS